MSKSTRTKVGDQLKRNGLEKEKSSLVSMEWKERGYEMEGVGKSSTIFRAEIECIRGLSFHSLIQYMSCRACKPEIGWAEEFIISRERRRLVYFRIPRSPDRPGNNDAVCN